ncbi:fungal-specific transcription factor domain-containing protein [Penicillium citrinum]|uniref:Fungal-specific transcription factor domain-containing protein n=1 Tax=Penicillium citrinum TaxID=5077 RepID=A0A9W9P4S3_PENCI|nr:fungal-specific transcription factor domain-containing protein [Penicillium citrinum]KAJ5235443.1 fungal-specific transcription factor domain-containing protein [Penicillium citrinum]
MFECVRCRQHKIKCSGDSPCTNCQNRKASCAFAGEEAKIQITKRRLSELKRRKCELEKENLALQEQLSGKQTTPNTLNEDVAGLHDGLDRGHPTLTFSPPDSGCDDRRNGMDNTEIKNSLSTGPPAFIRDIAGDPRTYCPHLKYASRYSPLPKTI